MSSFLDELRAAHDSVLATAEKVLPVPERGVLPTRWRHAVRFRPPTSRDKLTTAVAAYRTGAALDSKNMLQLIVDCHDEVLRRGPAGEWEPVDAEGGPLRFDASDERWGSDVSSAQQCVSKLYHLDSQPLALDGTADTLIDWLQGLDAEALMRAEGESDGGATPSPPPPPSN